MTAQLVLEQYKNLQQEFDRLEQRIQAIENEIVADTVHGSALCFPYTEHSMTVRGIGESKNDAVLKEQKKKLAEKLAETENIIHDLIDRLPTSKQRRIARLRIIDGMTWQQTANRMGCSAASVKAEYYCILKLLEHPQAQ